MKQESATERAVQAKTAEEAIRIILEDVGMTEEQIQLVLEGYRDE